MFDDLALGLVGVLPVIAENEFLRVFRGYFVHHQPDIFRNVFIARLPSVAYSEHNEDENDQKHCRGADTDDGEQPAVLRSSSDITALSLLFPASLFGDFVPLFLRRRRFENDVGIFLEFFYIGEHFARVLVSCLNVFAHRLHDDMFDRGRDVGNDLRGRNSLLLNLHERDRNGAVGVERQFARQHLIKDNARRIYIAPLVGGSALRLLGADIMNRSDRLVRDRYRAVILDVSDAEIHDLDGLVAVNENYVLRLYVAVNDAAFVRVFKRGKYLFDDMKRVVNIERPVFGHILFQRRTFEVFHNDILHVALEIDVKDVDDILVRKHCDRAGLIQKAAAGLRLFDKFFAKDFESDKSALLRVLSLVNDAHSARSDNLFDRVSSVKDGSNQSVFHI